MALYASKGEEVEVSVEEAEGKDKEGERMCEAVEGRGWTGGEKYVCPVVANIERWCDGEEAWETSAEADRVGAAANRCGPVAGSAERVVAASVVRIAVSSSTAPLASSSLAAMNDRIDSNLPPFFPAAALSDPRALSVLLGYAAVSSTGCACWRGVELRLEDALPGLDERRPKGGRRLGGVSSSISRVVSVQH